ncbi:uncharacterized protein LOC143150714 [Ptiloglossa arizonensis]|uniref:uncharacterized protein LOC143150714 n=1 Tax=Ptiloglossa arizonensis TaxID=3350558 RepID=UPI003FA13466
MMARTMTTITMIHPPGYGGCYSYFVNFYVRDLMADFTELFKETPVPARFRNRTSTHRRKSPPGTFRERFGFVPSRRRLSISVPGSPITITRRHEPRRRAPHDQTPLKNPLAARDCCPVQIYNQPANRFYRTSPTKRLLGAKLRPIS